MLVVDVESPRPNMSTSEGASVWTEVDQCLTANNVQNLGEMIGRRGFDVVWRPDDSPGKQTSLHRAAELGSVECMQRLIQEAMTKGMSIDSPEYGSGMTPLFSAVKASEVASVMALLNAQVHVNARNSKGHSVLHEIAYDIEEADENKRDRLLLCLDAILHRPDVDLEAHSNSGFTPLLSAAKNLSLGDGAGGNSNLVSFCEKLLLKGASLEAKDREHVSARQLLENWDALEEAMNGQPSPPQRPFKSRFLDGLIKLNDSEQLSNLLSAQSSDDAKAASNLYIGPNTVLYHVVDKFDEIAVTKTAKVLLDAGADPSIQQLSRNLCLHRVLECGYEDTLNIIIDSMKKKKRQSKLDLMDQSFELQRKCLVGQKQSAYSKKINYLGCLKRIYDDDIEINVNESTRGNVKQTILHLAASFNNQEAMELFIQKGASLGFRKIEFGEDTGNILSVLKSETLNKAMDGCITHHNPTNDSVEDVLSLSYTLNLDYKFLAPPSPNSQSKKEPNEVNTLMEIYRNGTHVKALKHPLIRALLYAKWRKVRPFYFTSLFLYLAFAVTLTSFVYCLIDLQIIEEASKLQPNNATIEAIIGKRSRTVYYGTMPFIILLTLCMLLSEIFQFFCTTPKTYVKNFKNWLELLLILIVFILWILCIANPGVEAIKHLAAWAMIFAWFEFVLLLGEVPKLAIYVTMLRNVSWNFTKLIALYGALILAFTFSFNIILETPSFHSFWSTLPRAIVMGTGEFEYSDLSKHLLSSSKPSIVSAVAIFLVFLFVIFLVLMNVMTGLAVTDAQKVKEEKTLCLLKSRLKLIYLAEKLLLVLPRCGRLLRKVQIFSGGDRKAQLSLKLNERCLYYGDGTTRLCKLDKDTVDAIRSHHVQFLTEGERCLKMLHEIKDDIAALKGSHRVQVLTEEDSGERCLKMLREIKDDVAALKRAPTRPQQPQSTPQGRHLTGTRD